jgi:hypothetical protein
LIFDEATSALDYESERIVNLSPGMAVTVEIKTGSRTIISYLLSPLLCHRGSLRTQLFLHSANRRCVQGRVVQHFHHRHDVEEQSLPGSNPRSN